MLHKCTYKLSPDTCGDTMRCCISPQTKKELDKLRGEARWLKASVAILLNLVTSKISRLRARVPFKPSPTILARRL